MSSSQAYNIADINALDLSRKCNVRIRARVEFLGAGTISTSGTKATRSGRAVLG